MVKGIFLHNGGQRNASRMSHAETAQDIFNLLKGPYPNYLVLKFHNVLPIS